MPLFSDMVLAIDSIIYGKFNGTRVGTLNYHRICRKRRLLENFSLQNVVRMSSYKILQSFSLLTFDA